MRLFPGWSLAPAVLLVVSAASAQVAAPASAPGTQEHPVPQTDAPPSAASPAAALPTTATSPAAAPPIADPTTNVRASEAVDASRDLEQPAVTTDTTTDEPSDKGKKKKKKKRKDAKSQREKAELADREDDSSDTFAAVELGGGDDDDDDDGKGKKLPWEAAPKLRVGSLIHSQFAINDAPEVANNEFRLTNARIVVEWRQGSLLDAVAEVELSRDGDRESTSWAPMRDAFVRVSLDSMLRMRLGQFKRPFGKLALTPLRDLKLIRRGISDVWVNDELEYGERDVGFQVDGKVGRGYELHYALGVFNGPGRNRREDDMNGTKDFVGRVEGRFGKHVSVGFNVANKRFDPTTRADQRPTSALMGGADVLVGFGGFYGLVEGQYGDNYRSTKRYHTGSLLALVAYKIPITNFWQIAVEPVVKGEILKVETEVRDQHILNGTAGANLLIGKAFRLMVQGEWIKPTGSLPMNLNEGRAEKRLIFQAGMYTR
ncbi:MAG TPA: porin [Polyangiaceae bacterium]